MALRCRIVDAVVDATIRLRILAYGWSDSFSVLHILLRSRAILRQQPALFRHVPSNTWILSSVSTHLSWLSQTRNLQRRFPHSSYTFYLLLPAPAPALSLSARLTTSPIPAASCSSSSARISSLQSQNFSSASLKASCLISYTKVSHQSHIDR